MTLSLSAVRTSAIDLLLVARHVTAELESAFGVLGPPQINREGAVRWRYFYRSRHDWLREWAAEWDVEVLDDENLD